jgi:uncharacterized protein with HEPN domain
MNRDKAYLQHIFDCIIKIESYSEVGEETFMKESHWQDAIIRNFEIIGEAAKRLSDETRNSDPDFPWRSIAGFRDFLIHEYMGVDLNAVWQIIEKDLPNLKVKVTELLSS